MTVQLLSHLADLLAGECESTPPSIDSNFWTSGLDDSTARVLAEKLRLAFGTPVYAGAFYDAPTLRQLAAYFEKHYAREVSTLCGETLGQTVGSESAGVDAAMVAKLRRWITPRPARMFTPAERATRNRPAAFILSAPRTGSSLLRIMLAGHTSLFSPPELNLLNFPTMNSRRETYAGRYALLRQGLVRAVMEVHRCGPKSATEIITGHEEAGTTTCEFYHLLLEELDGGMLVDKSVNYALDPETLAFAEDEFDQPHYIHLTRHPCGMINSFEHARFDRLFFGGRYPASPRQLGELLWIIYEQNISEFIRRLPAHRKLRVQYEDLVTNPDETMERVTCFLGVEMQKSVLTPFDGNPGRMTTGLEPKEKTLGDEKFYEHKRIDSRMSEAWKKHICTESLSTVALEMATRLGYELDSLLPAAGSALPSCADNDTAGVRLPAGICVHDLIATQATEIPDATAVISGDQQLSYGELDSRCEALAAILLEKGVHRGDIVAVCLLRSLEFTISALAVLKSGAVYLPIDPSTPVQRIKQILRDSRSRVALSCESLAAQLGDTVEVMDPNSKYQGRPDPVRPAKPVTHDDIAYLVYTSGSTGMPKGVLVSHGSLLNHTLAITNAYGIDSTCRRLQFASPGSDVHGAELYPFLAAGATLVVHVSPSPPSLTEFLQLLEENAVTHVGMPSAYWHEWARSMCTGQISLPGSLKVVISGMDRVEPELLDAWRTSVGNKVRWFNAYGPSEATITSTLYEADFADGNPVLAVPIGRSIANTTTYVLDEQLKQVPDGTKGELCIGGMGVAVGYLNRPDLTTERFLPDPFSDVPGRRLYRTGDIALRLPDGNLEFIGRADHQVKVRGFRVELGEIEAALARFACIRRAAVSAVRTRVGDYRLIAHVELEQASRDVTTEKLGRELGQLLPGHMVPATILLIDAMPLNAAGKIDRMALPRELSQSQHVGYEAPETDVEERLARLWEELLEVDDVGMTDDFFALGGHSLLAVRLFTRIERDFGCHIALQSLMENSTIQALAGLLVNDTRRTAKATLVTLNSYGDGRPLFFVHGGGGQIIGYRDLAVELGTKRPFYAISAPDTGKAEDLTATLPELAAQYLMQIREVQASGPYFIGGYCLGGVVALEMAVQLREMGDEAASVIMLNSTNPQWIAAMSRQGLRQKLRKHLKVTHSLQPGQLWPHYLSFIRGKLRELDYRLCFRLLKRLPPRWRHQYFQTQLSVITRQWGLPNYDGRVDLFRSRGEPSPPDLAWGDTLTGQVERHELQGGHLRILHKPWVVSLASRLNDVLEEIESGEAQTGHS